MHPATAVGIAGASTVAGLAILKLFFAITGFLLLCSAALASNIARIAPRFAIVVIPISSLMIAHYDLFGISEWSIWKLFGGIGYVYQYAIMSFMILGTLGGLQRRYNGDRPFIVSAEPLTFDNATFWEPKITPLFGWWLLSTALAIVTVAFVPLSFLKDYILSPIQIALSWIWHDFLQFPMVFNFKYFCLFQPPLNDACSNISNGRGFLGYFTIYPIGIFWLVGFVALYFVLLVAATFLPDRLNWLGLFWFLVGPAIPLFMLTTTYGLTLTYWGTYVAWGLYAWFVARMLWRRYQGNGRSGLWGGLRWSMAILATLVVASDIDWMLKQRFERNIFGVIDPTAYIEARNGRPGIAWGGLPLMVLGFSPTEVAFESLASLFDSDGESPQNTGATAPSSSAGKQAVIPPAQATPRTASAPVSTQGRSRELPLPPPPPPPVPALSASSPSGKPAPLPLSSSSRGAPSENLLGERKAPSVGSGSTGVNPR